MGNYTPDITISNDTKEGTPLRPVYPKVQSHSWHRLLKIGRSLLVLLLVGIPLAIPIIIYRNDSTVDLENETPKQKQHRQLTFYVFCWLLTTWLGGFLFYCLGCWLPYLFRFVARYVNPAHQRYWRVFRVMRRPVTLLGLDIVAYLALAAFVTYNGDLAAYIDKDSDTWDDILGDILMQATLWAVFYFFEKALIVYVTIHYHSRSDKNRIRRNKDMHAALEALYKASIHLYPVGSPEFATEDNLIATAAGNDKGLRRGTSAYLRKLGLDSYKILTIFGNTLSDEVDDNGKQKHWFRPSQAYAVVERALGDEVSATALATRVWRSLVLSGQETLRQEDIAEALGPYDDAAAYFAILDDAKLGSITLSDAIAVTIEAARVKHSIYASMSASNHVINTFDWVALAILAGVMTFFIGVQYIPALKAVKEILGFTAMGLSFAVGRTVHKFMCGSVFILFDHPYDVGDRVEIWNPSTTRAEPLIVERMSLLYTVFKRTDNGVETQLANERLALCRIENVSRSGISKQAVAIAIDVATSFERLSELRSELETFIKENPRDYGEGIGLNIVGLNDLDRMELKCSFSHPRNFADDKARSARSMRFYCALVAAIRKLGIQGPGGVGDQARPIYTVMLGQEKNRIRSGEGWLSGFGQADSDSQEKEVAGLRTEFPMPSQEAEEAAVSKLVKLPDAPKKTGDSGVSTGFEAQGVTGLRIKTNPGVETMFHR
ncbi:hypothetical protein K461DRAFT_316011 [Myriangium duriaei CBS 260.36]|uniref:Mechanosensitive ion channel protein n=1 Tax=Myriangium duriaei CBS 260.36 TaxID=1168546 RepID=A0A9P4IWG7_9PEZI|nr:hypothetical protein K461DRAFT_316011 [Myriangium duriaei CBS 260.36]